MNRNRNKQHQSKEPEHVLVYSTDPIPIKRCSDCHQPTSKCTCNTAKIKAIGKIKPVLQFEKKGRGGKVVTVLTRLPAHETYLKELCAYLKKAVGSGGTHYLKNGEGVVEIQGDWRKDLLALAQNYLTK